MDNNQKETTEDDDIVEQRIVDKGHTILILFFFLLGIISTALSIIFYNEKDKYWEIGTAFATSFYTAAIITILYHWVLINDISNLVAKKMLFNKNFLKTVFNKEKLDNLLQLLLEINLKNEMGALVKSDIIDQIAKDQVDYILYGFDLFITLSDQNSKFDDYYQITVLS
ncbi:MAG: hypothetical protein NTZ39_00420 [Methanoregula sp.]|nr:hypothetical protein [Methanoregula sp.]